MIGVVPAAAQPITDLVAPSMNWWTRQAFPATAAAPDASTVAIAAIHAGSCSHADTPQGGDDAPFGGNRHLFSDRGEPGGRGTLIPAR